MTNTTPQSHPSRKTFWSAMIGNVIDHYDTALYGFLAPFIAPVFFPKEDPIVALIFTYGLMSASIITRPLGALVFGKWGGERGGKSAMVITLAGLALTTGLMGLIPGYNTIGCLAPLCIVLLRMGQGFFAAGETTVAPLLILLHTKQQRHGQTNGYYGSTQIFGILIASLVATLVSMSPHPEEVWRWPFIASFLTGLVGLYMRYSIQTEERGVLSEPVQSIQSTQTLMQHKSTLFRIIALSSLTYITYSIPFVFMNSFVPQVTEISLAEMMMFNTTLLIFDMVMAPLIGAFSDRFSKTAFMGIMSFCLMLSAIPLFYIIPNSGLLTVTLVRIWIVLLGLGINVPFQPWVLSQITGPERYLLMGVGYSIGSELFGRNAPAICLWLWYTTGISYAPAFYISAISLMGLLALTLKVRIPMINARLRATSPTGG